MLGLLISYRVADDRLHPSSPILPGFVRRAWSVLFRRH